MKGVTRCLWSQGFRLCRWFSRFDIWETWAGGVRIELLSPSGRRSMVDVKRQIENETKEF